MSIPQDPISIARRALWVMTIPGVCLAACAHHGATSTPTGTDSATEAFEISAENSHTFSEHSWPAPEASALESAAGQPDEQHSEPAIQTGEKESASGSPTVSIDELLGLYRRLHTMMNAADRSGLITELLSDPRKPVLDLGFELAHRNLSSRTTLSPAVGGVTVELLSSADPAIRGSAAGLLTRLVTPDAMLRLTESLNREEVPVAAEPMLLGVARWPNEDATDAVVRWCTRDDSPFNAAASAAWAFEQAGLLRKAAHREQLLQVLRERSPASLQLPALKLLAILGDASDLQALAELLGSEDKALRDRVASALVETPRATDLVVRGAGRDPDLYPAASESLIRHRASPAGMQQLAELEPPNAADRAAALDRMSEAIDLESLTEGVALSGLDDPTSSRLLQRLLAVEPPRSARIARGLVLLAKIDLRRGMAIEALDIADSLAKDTLDPADRTELLAIQQDSAVLAGLLAHPSLDGLSAEQWLGYFERAESDDARETLRAEVLKRFPDSLSAEQTARLDLENEPNTEPEN